MKTLQKRLTLIVGLLLMLLVNNVCYAGESPNIIAVAADNQEITGQISGVAARAPYFIFFDKKGNLVEAIANPHANASGGASSKTTGFLSKNKVNLIIAGEFGSKMKTALKNADIKFIAQQGTVVDTIKEVLHVK